MQPSEKITPLHRRHDMGTPLSILSTDAREVNRESTAEATMRDQQQQQQRQRHRILKGGGGWRIGDRKGWMLPAVRVAAGNVVRIRATSRCWTRGFTVLQHDRWNSNF